MLTSPDLSIWRGRVDAAEGDLALRWHQVVESVGGQGPGLALLGFACDAGVRRNQGRPGAAEGPDALRKALANLPVHAGLVLREAGTVRVEGDGLEAGQEIYGQQVSELLSRGFTPVGLGGGHEIAYGAFLGMKDHFGSRRPRLGILNLDAHFDLRSAERPSSGTPFRQIAEACRELEWPMDYAVLGISAFANTAALFQAARDFGARWKLDEEMGFSDLPQVQVFLADFLARIEVLYLTVCLDVLPGADAPGVSAPSARGVALEVLEKVIDQACASGKVVMADVAELNPSLDEDQRTARTAARLVGRIASRVSRA